MKLKKNLDTIIKEKMLDEIVEGTWSLGMQISLEDIMAKYEVSRTPVIQALKEFAAIGIVKRTGKGHYFCEDFDDEEIRDIIDIRLMLEREALHRIMNRGGVDLTELEKTSEEAVAQYRAGDTVNTRRLDLRFHKELVDLAGSSCLSDIYFRVQVKFMMVNYLLGSHSAYQQKIACDDHTLLISHMKSGDAAKADEIITKHINGAYSKIRRRFADEGIGA